MGPGKLKSPSLPGPLASWATFPVFLLLLFSESESLYPAGLSPSLLGSLNLGGETEVKRGLWLSESPKLNSDASTLPFQALLTQFIKQKCEPLCPPLHLCEMG